MVFELVYKNIFHFMFQTKKKSMLPSVINNLLIYLNIIYAPPQKKKKIML